MKEMKIILSGVETQNKGAELMLYAILQEIEREHPSATVYIPMDAIPQGVDYIRTPVHLTYRPMDQLKRWLGTHHIEGILSRLHLTCFIIDDARIVKNVDFFINANGFAFSDQCNLGPDAEHYWEKTLSGYKKQGTKIVFMPQAFGPIEKPITKIVVQAINKYAALIMPREDMSMKYLEEAGGDMRRVFRFTDFTSLVKGIVPSEYSHLDGACCIIPNMRMIEKGIMERNDYIDLLSRFVDLIASKGKVAYLLNHEGIRDENLAKTIARHAQAEGHKVEVVSGLNALEVKGLISTSYVCISSRFHGVASALNSCVPCLATSWSHKYAALFNDYKIEDGLLDISDTKACLRQIDNYLVANYNHQIRNHLNNMVPVIQNENRIMWKKIWETKELVG